MAEGAVKRKKAFPKGGVKPAPLGKQDTADIRYRGKRKIPAGLEVCRRGSQ